MPNPNIVSNPPPEVKSLSTSIPEYESLLDVPLTQPQFVERLTDVDGVAPYLQRIGAEPRGLLSACITERQGKYKRDLLKVGFDRNGEVSLPSNIDKKKADELLPTMDEQQAIKAGFGVCRIPASCSLPEIPTWSQQIGYPPERIRRAENGGKSFHLPLLRRRGRHGAGADRPSG